MSEDIHRNVAEEKGNLWKLSGVKFQFLSTMRFSDVSEGEICNSLYYVEEVEAGERGRECERTRQR